MVAITVASVLPAWVLFTTNTCPEEWFDATRTFICKTTVFGMDDDDNFNGEITTAADDEAFETIEEDIGKGHPAVEVVGMEVLNEPPPTIPLNNPWDEMTTGASKQCSPPPPDPLNHPPGNDVSPITSDVSPTQQQPGLGHHCYEWPVAGPETGAPAHA